MSTDIFHARSTDSGLSFGANVRVATAPTNKSCCGAQLHDQYGDYEGIAAYGGTAHPIWTDGRLDAAIDPLTGQRIGEEVFSATVSSK